ncbi:MAG: bifunctional 3-deoxy-7-phosphoheptulonate synthase/chorismate mutase [Candidatus Kapaibacterium sp.]
MKSLLFHTDATDLQVKAAQRALMTAGAANITRMSSAGRTLMLVEDSAGLIDIQEFGKMPGVEVAMEASSKNGHVATAENSPIYDSGIEGLTIIAGPCGIETEEQVSAIFARMASEGIRYVRAGAYKPRTSPHDYQGPGEGGLEMASEIARDYGLQLVSEVVDPRDVEFAVQHVAMIQIGTRSMQNFALLKEAGRSGMPVLLKRGMSATVEEWIGAAEHALTAGAETVIFCERGIRTFETSTRNTLDLLGAMALKERTRLRVIADPSHAAGRRSLVAPGALAAIAAGLDGVIVEVHHDPASARSDAAQALPLDDFSVLMEKIRNIREALRI